MKTRKGIILAGGEGTRLWPATVSICKQLLPVYDKPMIYYPLTTLMLAGISDILLISNEDSIPLFKKILKDGSQWGIKIEYAVQSSPRGIADAFIIGEKFIDNEPVALVLGDNIFHGHGLSELLLEAAKNKYGVHLFAVNVRDPERFGIIELNKENRPISIEEKPGKPKSNLAVTGLYFFDERVTQYAHKLKPSKRDEIEITDLNRIYLENGDAVVTVLNRGYSWFDMGTPSSLLQASNYVEIIQSRQAMGVACPEEVAWRMAYLQQNDFEALINKLPKGEYRRYLATLIN